MITTISNEARNYLNTLPRYDLAVLVTRLEKMLEPDPDLHHLKSGICSNLGNKFGCGTVDLLGEAWPYYSGDELYPVPSPHLPLHSREQWVEASNVYAEAVSSGNQWTGAYGNYRRSLVQFMLAQVELYLAEVDNV